MERSHVNSGSLIYNKENQDSEPKQFLGNRWTESSYGAVLSNEWSAWRTWTWGCQCFSSDLTHCSSDSSGEVAQDAQTSSALQREPEFLSLVLEVKICGSAHLSLVLFLFNPWTLGLTYLSSVESEVRPPADWDPPQRNCAYLLSIIQSRIVIANCRAERLSITIYTNFYIKN